MARWVIVGDTHGDPYAIDKSFEFAVLCKATRILQVGDFGYGFAQPDESGNDPWLLYVQLGAAKSGIDLWFIDGNHENHPKLWQERDSGKLADYAPNVHYVSRGSVLELDGVVCGFIGGAVSIDRNSRTIGKSYWPTETITPDEILAAEASFVSRGVTLIFSHDAPASATAALKHGAEHDYWERTLPADIKYDIKENRAKLENLLRVVRPELWLAGHYHYPYTQQLNETTIVGLDMSSHGVGLDGVVVLEIDDGQIFVRRNWRMVGLDGQVAGQE